MKRVKLAAVRAKKHWTLEQAAEQIGVDINTLYKWEKGKATPRAYNIEKLCEVYQVTAADLDLEDAQVSVAANMPLPDAEEEQGNTQDFIETNLTLRLFSLAFQAHTSVQQIQEHVAHIIKEYDMMHSDDESTLSRREALRLVVALPLVTLNLQDPHSVTQKRPEEILPQCAASLAACWELSKGNEQADLALAFNSASTYLPTLKGIVKNSSQHRQAAASLAGQCTLLKTLLGWHTESLEKAMGYASEALTYSKVAENIPLQIAIHTQLSWIYYYTRQWKNSLEEIGKAAHLLQNTAVPFPRGLSSSVYSTLAIRQAMYRQEQQALTSIRLAHEYFFTSSVTERRFIFIDHYHPSLLLEDGMAHIYLRLYDEALDSFSQIIDSNDLSSKMPVAERIRIEALNNRVMALLKSPEKDMEQIIKVWTAAIEGAKAMQSEQRFSETLLAYEIMQGIWSNEERITNLRELTEHW